ncbi:MAG: hypothetical protein K8W52_41595 [Deltaproteobacteria bacterium]|nr:hypothetical protein [Deltaproteobacteria bacterium]
MTRASLAVILLYAACEPVPATTMPSPAPSEPTAEAPSAPDEPTAPAAPADDGPAFGIGGGESDAHTHVSFQAPRALTAAHARVVVDKVAPRGLNFFALQVDFNNSTWAHGGLQDVDGPDGGRTRQANWGGLVDRGGGTDDYDKEDDLADLEKIQNPPVGQHVAPYAWKTGMAYDFSVERGAKVTLPAGNYRLISDRPIVRVDHPRTMWEWRFIAQPVDGGAPYAVTLYDAADAFEAFYVWNESGYGSTAAEQHTTWSALRYVEGGGDAQVPASWDRF